MSNKVIITKTKIDDLANSISIKSGVSTPITLDEMKTAVDSISTGSGIIPIGTLNINSNGTYDVSRYASAAVNVPAARLQTKTATPSESSQSITADSGYDGLSAVTVEAVSSAYVGSGVSRRTSSNLTVSGSTVTAPAGYYENAASTSVAAGSAGTPTATKGSVANHTITVTPSVTNSTGYITGGTKTGTGVSIAAYELVSGTLTVTSNGTVDVTNLASITVNVPTGSTINNQNKSITPTTSSQYVMADVGYTGLGTVTVNPIPSEYIIPAGSLSITSNGNNIDVAQYETVNVNVSSGGGGGIIPSGNIDITQAGVTDVTDYETATVPAGTTGTPVATKGIVNNHSISVTPSVTNTSGYITGGTKTGTAVTVTAAELESGNLPITSNGNNISVSGYSTVSVNVPTGGGSVSGVVYIIDEEDSSGNTVRYLNTNGATIDTPTDSHGGTVYDITGSVAQLQIKTITPTNVRQEIMADAGYDGLYKVIIEP